MNRAGYARAAMMVTELSRFSERPGFTLIGGQPTRVGPVVVRLDGSRNSFIAIRAAVSHAMTRTCGMIMLDETHVSGFPFASGEIEERERSAAEGILGNNHVSRLPVDKPGIAGAIERSSDLDASLLVLNADDVALVVASPQLLKSLAATPYDVLMLASGDMRHPA